MYDVLDQVIDEMTAPGRTFSLAQTTVRGIPMRYWESAPANLREFWLNTAGHGDKDYLIYEDERLTYTAAHDLVARVSNWFHQQGVGSGDRVAIAMRNYPEWMLSYWAITCTGAASVGINAWWVPEEMNYALSDSQPNVLICDAERLENFSSLREKHPDIKVIAVRVDKCPKWATPWQEVIESPPQLPHADIDRDDDACIFYTSGTTGKPKGAQLTHFGCVNNVFSTMFNTVTQAVAATRLPQDSFSSDTPIKPNQQATIIAAPLFHVTTNNSGAQVFTLLGGKLVHMYKWDAGEALRIIEKEKITAFSGVPIMTRELISHPEFEKRDTSSMDQLAGGGAPVQPDLVNKVSTKGKGATPGQGYGLTETCGVIAGSSGTFLRDKPTSAGRVVPVFDARAVDDQGNALCPGEIGEICLRGPQVIKGYLNRPEATAKTIVDGWLHTGDIGYVDEHNFIHLVDRAKDMVLRGGENVYCSEVEVALFKHDDVKECSVFSVPDDRLGEEVGAAILLSENSTTSADDIRDFCSEHLSSFKIPRYIWILETPLPRNATGKFLKRELQAVLDIKDAQ